MAVFTLDSFIRMRFKVKVNIAGQMVRITKAIGLRIRCMVKVLLDGLTVKNILENLKMTKEKVKVFLLGVMDASMTVSGRMENNTVKGFSLKMME